jgi:DNA-binding transcriptional MerR regulator
MPPAALGRASSERVYEIHEVAALTGLAAARLRAWERRHEVVRPRRLPNGYRVYSAEQVALLRAYALLIETGERIGDLALQPTASVLARAQARPAEPSPHGPLLEAAGALDRDRLESLSAQQLALRGLAVFAENVALPLARDIGERWNQGTLSIAAEHLASEVVLGAIKSGLRLGRRSDPLLLAACLPGERHERGLLAALARAQEDGWRVHYLGPDLPLEALVDAAWRLTPRAVALSGSDPGLVRGCLPALAALPVRMPPRVVTVLGGAGVDPHAGPLRSYGHRIGLDGLPRLRE